MNKEYYEAKANLCRDLFIQQASEGQTKEAGQNLLRMVNALTQIEMLKIKEEKANETNQLL